MARTDMKGFSHRIKVLADDVPENADKLMRSTVITIVSSVALATPVDTGRARANWKTQIGAPASGTNEAYPKGTAGSSGGPAAAAAINSAVSEMGKYNRSGVEVHVTNNLPYIGRLNEGSSKQAPANFVQTAIEAGLRAIRKSRLIK
jgi:hypothetical protein